MGEPSYRAQGHTGSALHATVSRRTERLTMRPTMPRPPGTTAERRRRAAAEPRTPPAKQQSSAWNAAPRLRLGRGHRHHPCCAPLVACPSLRNLRRRHQPCPTPASMLSFWKVRRSVLGHCKQGHPAVSLSLSRARPAVALAARLTCLAHSQTHSHSCTAAVCRDKRARQLNIAMTA